MGLTFAELKDTPLGTISFIAGDQGLEQVAFSSLRVLKERSHEADPEPSLTGLAVLTDLMQEMNAYLVGLRKSFSIEVNWELFTGFQSRVLARTAEVPYGEVVTYGQIAQDLGQPGASRAVGRALGANPMPVVIPCHRVIGKGGSLRGYAGGMENKKLLLVLEGHSIENEQLMKKIA